MITLIGGNIQGPNNLAVPLGSVSFLLNVDGTVIAAPYGFVSGNVPVVFQFDSTGNLIPTCQLWSNLELNPQNNVGLGTYYLVSFYDQDGAAINRSPMWVQFTETNGSTVDISELTAYATVGGNVIYYPIPVGGGGTVTSVAFEGDGTVLSATPSTPVTTTGNVVATLLTQSANLFLAGPTSGSAAAPTFRAITSDDLPVSNIITGTVNANQVAVGTGTGVIGSSAAFTFASSIMGLNAIVAATSGANQSSPSLDLVANYWTGSVSAADTWTIENVLAASGANPNSTLTFSHAGSGGSARIQIVPSLIVSAATTLTTLSSVISSLSGSVNALTSAGNASAGNTVYQGSFSGLNLPAGTQVTIAGFSTSANNGTFLVQSGNSTSITVNNPSGVAESASATSTTGTPLQFNSGNIVFSGAGVASSFSIGGTSTFVETSILSNTNGVPLVLGCNSDPNDALFLRPFQNANGDHGNKIGAIYDGTGAHPGYLTWGIVSSAHVMSLLMPDGLTGLVCSGTLFTTSSVGTATLQASTGSGNSSLALTGTSLTSSVVLSAPTLIESTTHTPSSSSDTGTTGQIAWDSGFIYICVSTNTWERVAIATW